MRRPWFLAWSLAAFAGAAFAGGETAAPRVFVLDGGGERVMALPSVVPSERNFLGVDYVRLTPELLEHFGVPAERGAMIARVEEDSPAARAGLEVGDIVTRVGDAPLPGGSLRRAVAEQEAGATVAIELWRDGERRAVEVTLERRERPQFDVGKLLFDNPDQVLFRIDPDLLREVQRRLGELFSDAKWKKQWADCWSSREDLDREVERMRREVEAVREEIDRMRRELRHRDD